MDTFIKKDEEKQEKYDREESKCQGTEDECKQRMKTLIKEDEKQERYDEEESKCQGTEDECKKKMDTFVKKDEEKQERYD